VEEPPVEAPQREERHREEPRIDAQQLLNDSGLVMVETDRNKAPIIAPPDEQPQHLGRPRRERPKSVPQEDELVQIETRK
jgi:hypothetical protein